MFMVYFDCRSFEKSCLENTKTWNVALICVTYDVLFILINCSKSVGDQMEPMKLIMEDEDQLKHNIWTLDME